MRQRLDAIWEDAIFYGRATTNPAAAIKRKLGETRPVDEKQHLAALDYRQAPALLARIRSMPGTAARALEFGVLTASRTKEILNAELREIDLEAKIWTIPKERMKGKEEHAVYLSPRAVEIVAVSAPPRGQFSVGVNNLGSACPAMAPADSSMLRSRNRSGGIRLPVCINPETGTRLAPARPRKQKSQQALTC